jgi:hypothetical protein
VAGGRSGQAQSRTVAATTRSLLSVGCWGVRPALPSMCHGRVAHLWSRVPRNDDRCQQQIPLRWRIGSCGTGAAACLTLASPNRHARLASQWSRMMVAGGWRPAAGGGPAQAPGRRPDLVQRRGFRRPGHPQCSLKHPAAGERPTPSGRRRSSPRQPSTARRHGVTTDPRGGSRPPSPAGQSRTLDSRDGRRP